MNATRVQGLARWGLFMLLIVALIGLSAWWRSDQLYENCVNGQRNRAFGFSLLDAFERAIPAGPNTKEVGKFFDDVRLDLIKQYPPIEC